jgi:hypothetical protein
MRAFLDLPVNIQHIFYSSFKRQSNGNKLQEQIKYVPDWSVDSVRVSLYLLWFFPFVGPYLAVASSRLRHKHERNIL